MDVVYDSTFLYTGQTRDEKWIEKRKGQLYGYEVLFLDFSIFGKAKNFEKLIIEVKNFIEGEKNV